MQSRSKKAQEVRDYFIQVEKMLFKYREHIFSGLQMRIHELTRNQQPKYQQITSRSGLIYVIKASSTLDSIYKIGRTTNLPQRLSNYNSGNADDVEVVFQYETEDLDQVEACIKGLLKKHKYRKYKEVYQADIDMIKAFTQGCSELKMKYRSRKPSKLLGGYYIAVL